MGASYTKKMYGGKDPYLGHLWLEGLILKINIGVARWTSKEAITLQKGDFLAEIWQNKSKKGVNQR